MYVTMSANDVLEFHPWADIVRYIDETLVHHGQTQSHVLMKL
jgi:hypothetical protein